MSWGRPILLVKQRVQLIYSSWWITSLDLYLAELYRGPISRQRCSSLSIGWSRSWDGRSLSIRTTELISLGQLFGRCGQIMGYYSLQLQCPIRSPLGSAKDMFK